VVLFGWLLDQEGEETWGLGPCVFVSSNQAKALGPWNGGVRVAPHGWA